MTRCAKATGAGINASHLPMKLLAIPLSQQAGKWLIIPQTAGSAITSDLASVVRSPSLAASSFISNVPERGRPMGSPLLHSDPFALTEMRL